MSADAERAHERERLLLATLPHIAFDGWTGRALAAGCRDAGLLEADGPRLFPGGPAELFRALNDWADARMAEAVARLPAEGMRLSERIEAAVLARLDALAPHREAIRRGIAFAALPQNGLLGPSCLARAVDRIWRAAGDRSADFSYYTKRLLLAGVLASTMLIWLDDRSAEGRVTRAFLARRLADVLGIRRLREGAERRLGRLPDPFALLAGRRRRRHRLV